MEIQSLSIVVPSNGCINCCPFCVSRMHTNDYKDLITGANESMIIKRCQKNSSRDWKSRETIKQNYMKRLAFARDNGCNTAMLTGCSEPQQNMPFIRIFSEMNHQLDKPFRNIEMQTTGANFTEEMIDELANSIGVTTMSISVSCISNDDHNSEIINNKRFPICLSTLCKCIKDHGMNLRLSLNVTKELFFDLTDNDHYESMHELLFSRCKSLGADQVTFRKMFSSDEDTDQSKWVKEHRLENEDLWFMLLNRYVIDNGRFLNTLEYGNKRYSVSGMSVVIDEDCMAKDRDKSSLKYLILRPNCKLYTQWDDEGSLLF